MLLAFGGCFCHPPTCLLAVLLFLLLPIILKRVSKGKPSHLDMPDTNLAGSAVEKRQSSFERIIGQANFSGPNIGSTTRDDADHTRTPPGAHHPVENLVDGSIATITYYQVIVRFSCPGCQFHAVPAILFNGNFCFPTSRRQYGNKLREPCHVLPCVRINHQAGSFAFHFRVPPFCSLQAVAIPGRALSSTHCAAQTGRH